MSPVFEQQRLNKAEIFQGKRKEKAQAQRIS